MKTIHIFGATGSIGQSAADIVLAHPDKFCMHTVTAGRDVQKLADIALKLRAKRAVIADETAYEALRQALSGRDIECAAGSQALEEAALEPADISLMAIVGIAGLRPLWAALSKSKAVAVANKEPLVAAGPLVMARAAEFGTKILPLDSEHNALFQVFEPKNCRAVKRLILTASGGPFRGWSRERMKGVTPAEALRHPTWSMGPKISIDSATMMNKALEIIEARYLFDIEPGKIDVLVHPQSLVHGMVEYVDGSVLCQMGASDMRTPIASALAWPGRIETPGNTLDFSALKTLDFEKPDTDAFPALSLAYRVMEIGLGACVAMNTANEVMVDAFLRGACGFLDIVAETSKVIQARYWAGPQTLDNVESIDQEVRSLLKCSIVSTVNPKVSLSS